MLTHVRGAHVLKFGYEGWFGDDVEPFQGPWSQPKFGFDNLLTLAQDAPNNENGVMYDPVTGQQKLWEWNAASRTWGVFAQDTWTARRNLTVTLGFRFDNQGNPYSRTDTTVFGNFYLGEGQTFEEHVANGVARPTDNALNHSPKAFNPRAGVAWDVTGKGDWVVRSGFGVYANWLTQANVQEEFRGNPPGLILPTFFPGSASPPMFAQGTGDTPPFGFTFPSLAGSPLCPVAPCLDAKGGIAGAASPIGGINPDLKTPTAYIYTAAVEHKIGHNLAASVLYSGSHSENLVGNGNQAGLVSYGVDINAFPGDLLDQPANAPPTRLNPSFGSIMYADNDRVANYNGVTFNIRGRAKRIFFDASYTRSSSKDDAGLLPDVAGSAPVLWAVAVGRPPPLLAYGELRGARVQRRPGIRGPVDVGVGSQRPQHPAVRVPDDRHHHGAVYGWRRFQRRRRQSRLPERQQLRHEQIARCLSERSVFTRTVQCAPVWDPGQREAATVPPA